MNARVTTFKELRNAVGLLNGIGMWLMAVWPRWLGSMMLKTTVDFDGLSGRVDHTTRVTWLGVPLMKSLETVSLADDGMSFSLQGESRITLMPWARHPVLGSGRVDEAARVATYRLSWFGAALHQTTDLQSDRIELRQEAPGFQAYQVLNRQP